MILERFVPSTAISRSPEELSAQGLRDRAELLKRIRGLEDFPKMLMVVGAQGDVGNRWGITLETTKTKDGFEKVFLTWHGIYVAPTTPHITVTIVDGMWQTVTHQIPVFNDAREIKPEEYPPYVARARNAILHLEQLQKKSQTPT